MTAAPGALLDGRWRLSRRVVHDDRREVWLGRDEALDRTVRVETYQESRPELRAVALRRARAAVALSHPAIVSTFAAGERDDRVWFAGEQVDGKPLSGLLDQADPLAQRAVLEMLGQAALALRAAHDAGISHGQLDPACFLVLPDGTVKLAGFAAPLRRTTGPATTEAAADLRALGAIGRRALGADATEEALALLARLEGSGVGARLADAGDIGRAALALASDPPVRLPTTSPTPTRPPVADSREHLPPSYDDRDRRRIRNRLLAVGGGVVLAGLIVLKLLGGSSATAAVPDVVGLSYPQAVTVLHRADLGVHQRAVTNRPNPAGTVLAQSPAAGARRRVGSIVTVDVATGGSRGH